MHWRMDSFHSFFSTRVRYSSTSRVMAASADGWTGAAFVSGGIGGSAAVDSKDARTVTRRVGCMNNLHLFAITAPSPLIQRIQTAELTLSSSQTTVLNRYCTALIHPIARFEARKTRVLNHSLPYFVSLPSLPPCPPPLQPYRYQMRMGGCFGMVKLCMILCRFVFDCFFFSFHFFFYPFSFTRRDTRRVAVLVRVGECRGLACYC